MTEGKAGQILKEISNAEKKMNEYVKTVRSVIANDLIFKRSQELVPYETGNLRKSGAVKNKKNGTANFTATIEYVAPYAFEVHEFPESFKYTTPGTGPKYLQRAVDEATPQIRQIARDIFLEIIGR